MKPSEMSNEELVAMVRDWASSHMTVTDDYVMDEFDEIAARLRNSIPKPVVEVEADLDNGEYWIRVNDAPFRVYNFLRTANLQAKALRTALGINDTEGGS